MVLLNNLFGLFALPPSHHELLAKFLKQCLVPFNCTFFYHSPCFFVRLEDLFEVLALHQVDLGIVFNHTKLVGVAALENKIYVTKELTLAKHSQSNSVHGSVILNFQVPVLDAAADLHLVE